MITIGQLINVANAGDNIIDAVCGGNTEQTLIKLKEFVRNPDKVARLHTQLCNLEQAIKGIRSTKIEVKP
jgi:hypothetical protein